MNEQSVLLERLLEAAKIAGNLKKLAEKANINYVQLSRVKSFLQGTSNPKQKYNNFSVQNLQKLADAIDEDITFFTDKNYISKNQRNVIPISSVEDPELSGLKEYITSLWNSAAERDKGLLAGMIEKACVDYIDILKRRTGIEVPPPASN